LNQIEPVAKLGFNPNQARVIEGDLGLVKGG
jgi:hypothetical protein